MDKRRQVYATQGTVAEPTPSYRLALHGSGFYVWCSVRNISLNGVILVSKENVCKLGMRGKRMSL